MNNLLFDERPLVILPSLAVALGDLDEAAILQQIHYWTQKNMNVVDGYSWVYNSMDEWQKQFPWLSKRSLDRKFKKLKDKNLLIIGNYNKKKFDKTNWYRINYEELNKLSNAMPEVSTSANTDVEAKAQAEVKVQAKAESKTQTNQVKTSAAAKTEAKAQDKPNAITKDKYNFDYAKFIDWFNEITGKNFRNTEDKRKLIRARLNEGFKKDDFYLITRFKVNEWKDNDKMKRYLRPDTLFIPKHFDNYLQDAKDWEEKQAKKQSRKKVKSKPKKNDEPEISENDRSILAYVEENPDVLKTDEVIRKEVERIERTRAKSRSSTIKSA